MQPPLEHVRTYRPILQTCLGLIALVACAAAEETITAVRFWTLADATRIAVEGTGTFEFHSDRIANPERIFFDLPGTRPRLGDKYMSVIAVGDQLLKQIRVAETHRGVTRIVLDLQVAAVEVSTSRLENPDRLIIELRKPGSKPPAQTAAEPRVTERVSLPVEVPNEPRPPGPRPVNPMSEARKFQPPSRPILQTSDRRVFAPPLDPPRIESANLTTGWKNDPLSRLRKTPAAIAPRPPPKMTSRIAPAPEPPEAKPVAGKIGLPAKHPNTNETMIRALGLKVGRIVIDAGHGGHDTGSIGPGGLLEKDLVLDIAKRVGAMVEQQFGGDVIFTRSDDTFIPLERRTEIANESRGDLFLSIHANSSSIRAAAGVETYYLNFTTSRTALEVAARENASSEKSVFELRDLLQKIALKDKVDESREFAARIQDSLDSIAGRGAPRVRDRGVRKAPFVVLIGANMPSVLAEIGFISNPRDEALMKRPEYRQRVAECLFKGLAAYAKTLSHFDVAQSRGQ